MLLLPLDATKLPPKQVPARSAGFLRCFQRLDSVARCVASSTPDQARKSREETKLKSLRTNRLENIKLIRNRQVASSSLALGSRILEPASSPSVHFSKGGAPQAADPGVHRDTRWRFTFEAVWEPERCSRGRSIPAGPRFLWGRGLAEAQQCAGAASLLRAVPSRATVAVPS